LADLEREEATRKAWAAWQGRMKADFDKTAAFSGGPDLMYRAWERFLIIWAKDNPLSKEDEALRIQAIIKRDASRQLSSLTQQVTPQIATNAGPTKNCKPPVYPPESLRIQESGTVQLRFRIDLEGKVLESNVEKSSGYNRLDEAARSALSECQFKPAMVDGKPEASWASLRYVWKIE